MRTVPHPAQSPDLNPIENVWNKLKIQLQNCPQIPRTRREGIAAIQEEWAKIDPNFVNKLIEGMPKGARGVKLASGGHTRY